MLTFHFDFGWSIRVAEGQRFSVSELRARLRAEGQSWIGDEDED